MGRLTWQIGEVIDTQVETARAKSIALDLPHWIGHQAGQHVDVCLTAEDRYQAERSYSIASPPEEAQRVTLTVEQLDDGEVSPYLTEELRIGDKLELRGPIGGYFVWEAHLGGPLLLVAGGSISGCSHTSVVPPRLWKLPRPVWWNWDTSQHASRRNALDRQEKHDGKQTRW